MTRSLLLPVLLVLLLARPAEAARSEADASEKSASPSESAETAPTASSDERMTLDAITIEGEIDVPRVLFLTARDHLGTLAPLHDLYRTEATATVLALPMHGPARPPADAPASQDDPTQRETSR